MGDIPGCMISFSSGFEPYLMLVIEIVLTRRLENPGSERATGKSIHFVFDLYAARKYAESNLSGKG